MYNQELLKPRFSIEEFVNSHTKRKIDIEEEGYDIIQEALDYFKELEIPKDLLLKVEKIFQDGGDEVYMELCPFWDGEDDIFNITSLEDLHLVPNLKEIILFFGEDDSILHGFKAK